MQMKRQGAAVWRKRTHPSSIHLTLHLAIQDFNLKTFLNAVSFKEGAAIRRVAMGQPNTLDERLFIIWLRQKLHASHVDKKKELSVLG